MPVGVNETADDVFLDVVDDGDVNDSLATVYSADAPRHRRRPRRWRPTGSAGVAW